MNNLLLKSQEKSSFNAIIEESIKENNTIKEQDNEINNVMIAEPKNINYNKKEDIDS
jgi:hypothetical protein